MQEALQGDRWWLDSATEGPLAAQHAELRTEIEPWQPDVERWLRLPVRGREFVTTSEVLRDALGIETSRQTTADARRLATIMEHLGWTSGRGGNALGKPRGWKRPEPDTGKS